MGHQRLGKLPAHRLLPEIIRYLVAGGTPTKDLVDQVTEICRDALKLALKDPVFIEALWLLVRIPQAAGSGDFLNGLRELGLPVATSPSLSDMLVAYNAALEKVQRRSLSLSQMSSGWPETPNRVILLPDVGRLQSAVVAAHRVIPITSVT
jgi:hypothetical protein